MTTVAEPTVRIARDAEVPGITCRGVGVRYSIPNERIRSFKEYVLRRLSGGIGSRELWALRDVDLDLAGGEVLGVVGRNGAGKSTLLKAVTRVLRPTAGRVVVRGRVAPLIDLGAGFHPDLTGRENVVLNATLLGHSRQRIEAAMSDIVGFAELEAFVDAPVRSYSDGMLARLGFSVATQFRPDVLVLDEILAVGDAGFQKRCLQRIDEFRAAGTAVLLVSHDADTVAEHCDRVVWMREGRVAASGPAGETLEQYLAAFTGGG